MGDPGSPELEKAFQSLFPVAPQRHIPVIYFCWKSQDLLLKLRSFLPLPTQFYSPKQQTVLMLGLKGVHGLLSLKGRLVPKAF